MASSSTKTTTKIIQDNDVLECFLYPKCCYTMTADSVTDALLSEEINKFNEVINEHTKNYIWHRDSLVFYPKTKQKLLIEQVYRNPGLSNDGACSVVPHIYAVLRYDEDVGDEWFVTFLIYKLTELINGLIARIIDSDGEFLLVEAANYLPRWASDPESCQDRVHIYDGRIHVVQDKRVSMLNQLKRISENAQNYQMSDDVQGVIKKRISIYPDEIDKRKHKARVFLPEKAAAILKQYPELISPVIRTIVHSDPLERKVCRAMKYFPPEQRVMVNVGMTKCLYAMASHCRYTGDPRTGWNFPPITNPQYNTHILGIKIACGLEILVSRANEQVKGLKKYASPINSHTGNSGVKQEKTEACAQEITSYTHKDHSGMNIAMKVLEAWKNVKTEEAYESETALSPPDGDSWMNVDATQLEAMLSQHWSYQSNDSQSNNASSLKNKVKVFLNKSSDVDGIKFSRDGSYDEDDDDDDNGKHQNNRIDFDADVFDSTLRDILDLVVPGGDGEFDGSSEGSLGGDEDDDINEGDISKNDKRKSGVMNKYMELLDSQLKLELSKDPNSSSNNATIDDTIESNLIQSMEEEAGGAGPASSIIGGPIRRLMHLQLQSPTTVTATTVPPDLQS